MATKIAPKSSNKGIRISNKPAKSRSEAEEPEVEEVEEVEEVDPSEVEETDENEETPEAEEVEEAAPAAPSRKDMVRVSIFTEIDPAPRIGKIDLPNDYGISKLTVGVHSLPRTVAEVLVDRGFGAMV